MYFTSYLRNHVCIFILASMVLFLIFTVHSYVAPTLNTLIIILFSITVEIVQNYHLFPSFPLI